MKPLVLKNTKNSQSLFWILAIFAILVGNPGHASDEAVEQVSAPVPFSKPASVSAAQPSSPAEARDELQRLLDDTLSLATDELHKTSTFYPFLAGITKQGKIELIGVPQKRSRPKPQTVIKALRKAARQLAKKKRYRAIALYVDFVAERKDTAIKQPGILVELEHQYPDALSVFIPYFIHSDNRISLMTPQFMPIKPHLFVAKKNKNQ